MEFDAPRIAYPLWLDESLLARRWPKVHERFQAEQVPAKALDILWAEGWRHFGLQFVRYSARPWNEKLEGVVPVRVVLKRFEPSKSQRRILRQNADLEVRIAPATLDATRSRLFNLHKKRFRQSPPSSLRQYLGPRPGTCPCQTMEFAAYAKGHLIATSYLDLGEQGVSTQYGMFHPLHSKRSLGTCTMLWEMAHGQERGCDYYYMGYVFSSPSELDYKRNFNAVEWFDWQGNWRSLDDFPR